MMSMRENIIVCCVTHALKAKNDHRNVDFEVFTIAADEIIRLRKSLASTGEEPTAAPPTTANIGSGSSDPVGEAGQLLLDDKNA